MKLALIGAVLLASAVDDGPKKLKQPWDYLQPPEEIILAVAPHGKDSNPGTREKPFATLARAQKEVRQKIKLNSVVVEVAEGSYQLDKPLHFGPKDGGKGRLTVTWRGVGDRRPVISGATQITGWSIHDKERNIYVANTPKGLNSRQLWIDSQRAVRGQYELKRQSVSFSTKGINLPAEATKLVQSLKEEKHLEVLGVQAFTNRISPVKSIQNNTLVMTQPAWRNNIWGYDTIPAPAHIGGKESARLFLVNALAFVDEPGEWFLDPEKGKLYVIPPTEKDINKSEVLLPHLSYLASISGTDKEPIRNITFENLRFSYSTWLAPSGPDGYANQQSGAFITGETTGYPADPINDCSWGCPAFETRRNEWQQIPGAVQISAAERIVFDQNVFAHLGQVAIGVGNDANAHASGVGLGTTAIRITRNVFTDLSGGAIFSGGVQRDAHHPSRPSLANRHNIIQNNRIHGVSKEYQDNSAILSTYVDGAIIMHNDISDAMYDAIDIGWGWGINDIGGNPDYRKLERLYYDHPQNLVYDTPTLHRNVTVAYNRIYDVKKFFHDGGAIYNLSASYGTRIYNNHIFGISSDHIGIYLDEGSKGVTVKNNIVHGGGLWLNANTVRSMRPYHATYDNVAIKNWHTSKRQQGWAEGDPYNRLIDNQLVDGKNWPEAALKVIKQAGIQKTAGPVEYKGIR